MQLYYINQLQLTQIITNVKHINYLKFCEYNRYCDIVIIVGLIIFEVPLR